MNNESLKDTIIGRGEEYMMKMPNPDYIPSDEQIRAAFETLKDREIFVLKRRFGNVRMTLQAIGDIMPRHRGGIGISKEVVRQVEAKALRKLRHPSRLRILGIKYSQ